MARSYTLKRRAELQAQTRQRIVAAAVELHGAVGPAKTTVSMIAKRAGVQRHTFYSHFPDERSMLLACSGHSLDCDPLPVAEPWRAIAEPIPRLRVGLGEIYAWFERNERLLANVLRDSEFYEPVREISALRYAPAFLSYTQTLAQTLNAKQSAMLPLALSFYTWRTLVRETGLTQDAAVETMAAAIGAQSS